MRKTLIFAAALSLAVAAWLATAAPADAATYRTWHPAAPVVGPTRHMPGWDWWRTYPWSPYNYGRNPYNPIVVPYPYYAYPYTTYLPYPSYTPTPAPALTVPAELSLPSVTGPLASPPPGTALIRVQVPDAWAKVTFDGHDSFTSGTQRYFVTPRLDGRHSYEIASSWPGHPAQHRTVRVQPGETSVVTFGR